MGLPRAPVMLVLAPLATIVFTVASAAAGPRCAKGVELTGEAALVGEIADRLKARGFGLEAVDGCPAHEVRVRARDGGLELDLTAPAGVHVTRLISDGATAAAVIEAWADSSLVEPLLAPPSAGDASSARRPRTERQADPAHVSAAAPDEPETPAFVAPSGPPSFVLATRVGAAYASDDSFWTSLAVSGCGRVGPLCLGFQVRGSFDPGVTGDSDQLSATRGGLDGLLTLDFPIPVGVVTLRPGLGAGIEWTRAARSIAGSGVNVDRDDGGLRFEGSFRLQLPLSRVVALDGGAAFDVSPLASASPTIDAEDHITLPGLPLWQIGAVFGLEFRFDPAPPPAVASR